MNNDKGGGNKGGRWGGLGWWGEVGGKGRKLYLNNNKKMFQKKKKEASKASFREILAPHTSNSGLIPSSGKTVVMEVVGGTR